VHTWPFRDDVARVAVVTGKATSLLSQAIALKADAILCGELEHSVYHQLREARLAAVLGGHYQTETVGLKALARHLGAAYPLETAWIEAPTGL